VVEQAVDEVERRGASGRAWSRSGFPGESGELRKSQKEGVGSASKEGAMGCWGKGESVGALVQEEEQAMIKVAR
jgi:hypothetical protein